MLSSITNAFVPLAYALSISVLLLFEAAATSACTEPRETQAITSPSLALASDALRPAIADLRLAYRCHHASVFLELSQ